jgi:hypothetical protein
MSIIWDVKWRIPVNCYQTARRYISEDCTFKYLWFVVNIIIIIITIIIIIIIIVELAR